MTVVAPIDNLGYPKENRIMCTIGGLGRHIGRQSTDSRPICAHLSTVGRPLSADLSVEVSADMSAEATYNTHDPENKQPPLAEGHSYIFLWQMKVKIKSIYE